MSYVSFFKNIPGMIAQPTGVAAIASVGIHGAIALIVPLMPANPSSSTETKSPEPVGLMELSAADQSRLPQTLDNSQLTLQAQLPLQQPQLPLQQQLPGGNLSNSTTYAPLDPTLANELNNQPVLPVIPSSASNYNLAALPQRQPLPNLNINNLNGEISTYKARTNFSPSSSTLNNDINTQISETESLPVSRLPELRSNAEIPADAMENPTPEPIDIGSRTASLGTVPSTNNSQIPENGEKLAVVPQNLPSQNEQSSQTFSDNSDTKVKINDKLLRNLKSFNNLREGVKEEFPKVKEKAVIRETIANNTIETEGTVLGRLVVDPDGKVVDIKFQEDSGSPQLQAKAREFFKANPPKADQEVTSSYPFQLQFKHKTTTETEIPKTEPASIPVEKKLPESQANKVEVNDQVNSVKPVPADTVNSNAVESNDKSEKLVEKLRKIREEKLNNNN